MAIDPIYFYLRQLKHLCLFVGNVWTISSGFFSFGGIFPSFKIMFLHIHPKSLCFRTLNKGWSALSFKFKSSCETLKFPFHEIRVPKYVYSCRRSITSLPGWKLSVNFFARFWKIVIFVFLEFTSNINELLKDQKTACLGSFANHFYIGPAKGERPRD